ncbi:MAG TPA: GGDEF domain-containing protein [Thermoanaerobaculia bacterium]|nr:GGDEF domain-containing protein [Thermoanaerobaculia bacterium]
MPLPAAFLLRLVFAVAIGTLGLLALLLGLAWRFRPALALYAALALAVSFHLGRPLVRSRLLDGAPDPLSRLDALFAFLIPLFALGVLFALGRDRRRPARSAALLFVATGTLLLGALADVAIARQVLVVRVAVPLLAVGFLVFSVILLVVLADDDKRLRVAATTDPLTGLANRAAFLERARFEVQRAERSGRPLAVVILDLDRFKSVNDRFGHPAGDKVLVGAANAISRTIRGIDLAARWGGEEFAVLLVEADESTAGGAVERIREAVAAVAPPRVPASVTVSAGIAIHHGLFERSAVEGLLRRADAALYAAKEKGRNRAEFESALAAAPSTPADVPLR